MIQSPVARGKCVFTNWLQKFLGIAGCHWVKKQYQKPPVIGFVVRGLLRFLVVISLQILTISSAVINLKKCDTNWIRLASNFAVSLQLGEWLGKSVTSTQTTTAAISQHPKQSLGGFCQLVGEYTCQAVTDRSVGLHDWGLIHSILYCHNDSYTSKMAHKLPSCGLWSHVCKTSIAATGHHLPHIVVLCLWAPSFSA